MSKTTRQWLSQLKDEHRDLAIANADPAHIDNLPIEGGTLSAVLSFAFNWSDSPEGHSFWSNIHNKLLSDTYFDVPQQTPESCKAKAKEVMYGKPLPTDAAKRKEYVIFSGFIAYFPHAIAAVAHLSYKGNLQHHPDKPLHWDMDKSSDERDAMMRHIIDGDWEQVAWRALANLERKLTGKCTYENNH